MSNLNNDSSNLPQVVILSDDYNLSARLQQSLQKKHLQTIGFYYVEDAIEWFKPQVENKKLFIVDYEVNGLPWQETLRVFHENDLPVDSVILLKPNTNASVRDIKQLGACAVFQRDENLFKKIPDMLIALFAEIQLEKQQTALHHGFGNPEHDNEAKEKSSNETITTQNSNIHSVNSLSSKKSLSYNNNNERLKQYEKQVESRLQQNQTALFSSVAGEIKDSVYATISIARRIEQTQLSAEQKKLLYSLMITIGNQLNIINSLLDYSKMEPNNVEVVYHNFHVKIMTNEVISLFKHLAAEKYTKIKLDIHENVPDYIYGDKLKMQQVLRILTGLALNNNKSYTEIEVRVSSKKSYTKHLVFTIKDHDQLLTETPSTNYSNELNTPPSQHSGISLKIAQAFVDVMGGELVVNSNSTHGFPIVFSIPLLESDVAEVADDPNVDYGQHAKHLKILLAEDDVINQMYLAGFLRSQGWDVETAYTGITVLEQFFNNKYDLIILDGQMPGMDGFEAARRIRATEKREDHIPILAISGFAIPGDKQKFIDAGMDDYLPKPINEDELLSVIHKLTRKQSNFSENQ